MTTTIERAKSVIEEVLCDPAERFGSATADRIASSLHEAGMLVSGEPVAWLWTDHGIRFMSQPGEPRPHYAEPLYALPTEDRSGARPNPEQGE